MLKSRNGSLATIVSATSLSVLCACASYAAAGASLGLFFAALAFVTILTPPLTLAETDWRHAILAAACTVTGTAAVWLIATIRADLRFGQWAQCTALLVTYVAALAAVAALLTALRLGRIAATALTVLAGLAWLSWPVWLSPWLNGPARQTIALALVPAHPLLAVNGVLQDLGVWTEMRLVYPHTKLGQDISYQLPPSAAAAVLVHALLAGVALSAAWLLRRRRRIRRVVDLQINEPDRKERQPS